MPLHPSIAGPSALVDSLLASYDAAPSNNSSSNSSSSRSSSSRSTNSSIGTGFAGWSPLADALSKGARGPAQAASSSDDAASAAGSAACGLDASFLATLAAAPQPLFWVELPFPHPGTTLVDWVLHTADAPGARPANQGGRPGSGGSSSSGGGGSSSRVSAAAAAAAARQAAQAAEAAALAASSDARAAAQLTRSHLGSSGGGGGGNSGPLLRSAWEVQHMARLVLAILAAVHGAGHAHGALHPTAIEVGLTGAAKTHAPLP